MPGFQELARFASAPSGPGYPFGFVLGISLPPLLCQLPPGVPLLRCWASGAVLYCYFSFSPLFLLILFSKLSIGFLLISVLFKFWKLFLLFSEDYVFVTAKVALWVC